MLAACLRLEDFVSVANYEIIVGVLLSFNIVYRLRPFAIDFITRNGLCKPVAVFLEVRTVGIVGEIEDGELCHSRPKNGASTASPSSMEQISLGLQNTI